jgi:hypothetical protein
VCGVGVMCKCWFRALHLFLYSLAVYSPLSDSSDAALSPLECIGRRRARVRVGVQPKAVDIIKYSSVWPLQHAGRSSRANG